MSPLTLHLHTPPTAPLDLSPLTPDRLAPLSAAAIARLELLHGRERLRVGDLFRVEDGARDGLVMAGSSPLFDRVAAGMGGGWLRVEGDVGDELACGMRDGRVEVAGNAGLLAAASLAGGTVRVRGDVGAFAGGCRAGHRFGMTGGVLWVDGQLGPQAGARMRRGLVVAAAAGDALGAGMLGGTFLVRGPVGADVGYGLRRGTLVLAHAPAPLPPTFLDCGLHDFLFLELVVRELRARGLPDPGLGRRHRRLLGCRAVGGKGELLLAAGSA